MEIGDKLPEILGLDADGNTIRASDYAGRKLVLYFYPKDSTPGCTAEACSLRDNYSELRAKGYEVVGVSAGDAKSHKRFAEKNALPFPLIADTENELSNAFGVWGEKSMAGRKYMGIFRTTFIVGPDGTITDIWRPKEIKTKEHATQILSRS